MDRVTAACVQFSASRDKAENIERMAPLVAEAADRGATLVLLPEKWNAIADGDERLGQLFGQRVKPRARAPREDDAFHAEDATQARSARRRLPGDDRRPVARHLVQLSDRSAEGDDVQESRHPGVARV